MKSQKQNQKPTRGMVAAKAVAVGLATGTIAAAIVMSSAPQAAEEKIGAAVSTGVAPSVNVVPGTSNSSKHNKLVDEDNRKRADEADKTGKSAIPRITKTADNESKDPFDLVPKVGDAPKAPTAPVVQAPVETPPPAPAQAVVPPPAPQMQPQMAMQAPKKSAETLEREKNMAKYVNGLLAAWSPVGQRTELDFKSNYTGSTVGAAGAGQSAMVAAGGQAAAQKSVAPSVDIKAGSIIHAVIMTSINSDEPGPILAQVVNGPYSGARLMGNFNLANKDGEKLTMQFSVMTLPSAPKSYTFNGFAIDPDSGRTALASDVDHHYLYRYGTMLSANFLKGYSAAIKQSGTTMTTSTGAAGTTTSATTPLLNPKDKAVIALGEVGTALSAAWAQNFNRPNTITIDAGTPIGVLLMQDVSFQ